MTKTFPIGGIHPDKHKIAGNIPISDPGLPETVYIPIKQHIGAPAKILVGKGDKVKVGTLLAAADGVVSAPVHSSVSGEVIKVEDILGEFGYYEPMVTIRVEGDEWEKSIDRSPEIIREIPENAEEIVAKIRTAGIVGMGGAGYPTPIKTTVPEGKKVDCLILNGIECEPFLSADDRLMQEKGEQIIIGAKILNKLLGIQKAIIAIDENKPQAIEIMTRLTKTYVGVNVRVCESKYPQGGEKQLIAAITGREVPSGKLPVDVGCIVQNVGTVFAVYQAVMKNKPLFERVVTVSGDAIEKSANFMTRIGTPASFLIKQCGEVLPALGQIIFGGPMMGTAAVNPDAPITKLTSGILLLSEVLSDKRPESVCIRCGKCLDVCPMGLQPNAIARAVRNNNLEELRQLHVMDCIECGSCAYTCPGRLPLLDCCKLAKLELRKNKGGK